MFIITKKLRKIFMVLVLFVAIFIAIQSITWVGKLAYPTHHYSTVMENAEMYNIDPLLIYAIIRNESRFNTNAISRTEARGLMQIAPITGQWAAETLEIENYTKQLLHDPKINIEIGAWYLDRLNKQFNNNLELVIAAYNAGSGNVTNWLNNPELSKDGNELDYIPFGETRIYLRKVLRDYEIYKRIYNRGTL
ncbi:lytic transglycosylase domain-containing protein [Serpentinicella sp. ANB-PHB4]|uniref:lytic transglycosylase domain-containing protein n=1 Tax=Serpentinicella sp. ANB-PHB4 TaxID=3074076 RepID=UPI002864B088|nr:lytic transglycosylase domain-containing protein [Serpentinicella sp. ANB-PHB4]MDR5657950.1 lytic transglycosylase domain-containing protein [Serpentinicella sp. ANB-PHB4]